jgi:UDP-3-O-[3-hydroxymyristoyl] glucosamine N-acyltransferase
MGTRLGELVERLGGQLVGDPNLEVTGIAPLDRRRRFAHQLSQQQQTARAGAQSGAAALIVSPPTTPTVAATYPARASSPPTPTPISPARRSISRR